MLDAPLYEEPFDTPDRNTLNGRVVEIKMSLIVDSRTGIDHSKFWETFNAFLATTRESFIQKDPITKEVISVNCGLPPGIRPGRGDEMIGTVTFLPNDWEGR